MVSGNCTEFVNEYKYIGIVIGEKLSWESSISVIKKKRIITFILDEKVESV